MRMRIPTEPVDVITSANAIVSHLRAIGLRRGARIHVCGTDALAQFLRAAGFETTKEVAGVDAVVVAWNPSLVMEDIKLASDVARRGVAFVGANRDATYPEADGLVPGSGAIIAAVETASGRQATVVGKPAPELFALALERGGAPVERTLFVGDRIDSDVVGAQSAGIPVALVLSGVTSADDLTALASPPPIVVADLSGVLDASFEPSLRPSLEAGVVGESAGAAPPAEGDDEREAGEEATDVRPERDAAATLFDP
jgi:HAD superfamily hydrolase (TIGR01450 family)